jgi:carbon storage regulator
MLVLSRKIGERILVPQCGLSVTVVAVKGKTLRLAISAPAKTDIYREEIWHQVREDKRLSGPERVPAG